MSHKSRPSEVWSRYSVTNYKNIQNYCYSYLQKQFTCGGPIGNCGRFESRTMLHTSQSEQSNRGSDVSISLRACRHPSRAASSFWAVVTLWITNFCSWSSVKLTKKVISNGKTDILENNAASTTDMQVCPLILSFQEGFNRNQESQI